MAKKKNETSTPQTGPNIGWLFGKEYYRGFDQKLIQLEQSGKSKADADKEKAEFFKAKNNAITGKGLDAYREETEQLDPDRFTGDALYFDLTTGYPGLFTGAGTPHETGSEGEFKLGFYFDHTTGLPVIPGSSVKGVLRSAFAHPDYIAYLLKEQAGAVLPEPVKEPVGALERVIFEGITPLNGSEGEDRLPVYKRDIFFDGRLVSSTNQNGRFIGEDFITPHGENPFKAPVPLAFLKILPEVTFRFSFRLFNAQAGGRTLSAAHKKDLFEAILRDLGIGAKTNVGYGKFR